MGQGLSFKEVESSCRLTSTTCWRRCSVSSGTPSPPSWRIWQLSLDAKKTIDMNISWASLGETGSTFFFRSAQAKRQKLWVRSLEIPDDIDSKTKKLITETDKIQNFFFNYYEKLNTKPDPFSTAKFNDFFPMQLLEKINKLDSNNVKQKLNLPISIAELRNSISKLNKNSCGGPDGISSKLLEWFFKNLS